MGLAQVMVSGIMTLLTYILLIGAMYKLIVISRDVAEIKEILKKRDPNAPRD